MRSVLLVAMVLVATGCKKSEPTVDKSPAIGERNTFTGKVTRYEHSDPTKRVLGLRLADGREATCRFHAITAQEDSRINAAFDAGTEVKIRGRVEQSAPGLILENCELLP
jgi:hypothetical protein